MTKNQAASAELTAVARVAGITLPVALSDVALIDAPTCAAAGAVSVSYWHEMVAAHIAPQPVVRRPRCTRWRLAVVREFWRTFGEGDDATNAEKVKASAAKASAAARAKRAAQAAG